IFLDSHYQTITLRLVAALYLSKMKKISRLFLVVRAGWAFIQLVRQPGRLDLVYALSDDPQVSNEKTYASVLERIRTNPHMSFLWDARASGDCPDAATPYAPPPTGCLGKYLAFLNRENLQSKPLSQPVYRGNVDVDYVRRRIRQTHDLWHVVTGF